MLAIAWTMDSVASLCEFTSSVPQCSGRLIRFGLIRFFFFFFLAQFEHETDNREENKWPPTGTVFIPR